LIRKSINYNILNMHIIINDSLTHKSTTYIVFIHGFLKKSLYWNITENQNPIQIEESLRKKINTVLIDLDEEDYMKNITDISNEIYSRLKSIMEEKNINNKIILIGHSHGSFYYLRLAELYPDIFKKNDVIRSDNSSVADKIMII